jgi:hypothetical protein
VRPLSLFPRRLLELELLLRLLELELLLPLLELELLLRLLELGLLLRLLELELLLRLSPPPPRRPCAKPVGAAMVSDSIEVASTNVSSLFIIERVFICCLPCAENQKALTENEGLRFVTQYTPFLPYEKIKIIASGVTPVNIKPAVRFRRKGPDVWARL